MVYRLCTKDLHSFFLQNKPGFLWIAKSWIDGERDETANRSTFRAVIIHYQKRGRSPGSLDALLKYVVENPDEIKEFKQIAGFDANVHELEDYTPDNTLDDNLLFDTLLSTTRKRWLTNQYKTAAGVANGNETPDKLKDAGASASIRWLRGELAKDFTPESPADAGMLHENIGLVREGLVGRLADNRGDRFPLGLRHIDDCVTVGKQHLRFLAVLGMSGDGKTTLTNYICYNWLRQGAHVLYCSTEHSPQEIWEVMAFMHQSHPDYEDFTLPSLNDWDSEKGKVTKQDLANMSRILTDIQNRKNLPGLLDCQQFRDWDSIVNHLEQNHKANKYDILIVDYLGRLEVAGDIRDREQAMKKLVHDVQGLTRSFDGNKGLIVLTPIQVNREGNKKAQKAEEGESRYDLNAISTISEYQHDLDLCLSVWLNEDLRMSNQVEIQQIKQRKGLRAPTMRMELEQASRCYRYLDSDTKKVEGVKLPDSLGDLSKEDIGI
jgi:archaellum biogenesis ATPase FlaH